MTKSCGIGWSLNITVLVTTLYGQVTNFTKPILYFKKFTKSTFSVRIDHRYRPTRTHLRRLCNYNDFRKHSLSWISDGITLDEIFVGKLNRFDFKNSNTDVFKYVVEKIFPTTQTSSERRKCS